VSRHPAYSLADLCTDCGQSRVFVTKQALETAGNDFGLYGQGAVLSFIANGGLQHPVFQNCEPWHNNPNPSTPIYVDAYVFTSGARAGYIAFYQPANQRWVIKSFKTDDPSGFGKTNIFAHAFQNRGKLR
jgi:hypothetical protein